MPVHQVELIDGEFGSIALDDIVARTAAMTPEAILIGHSGSTSGHPIVVALTRMLRAALPRAFIIYGGVFPTYYWREILRNEPQIGCARQEVGARPGLSRELLRPARLPGPVPTPRSQ